MRARLKSSYVYPSIRACAGMEFVKDEWRTVPVDQEAAAMLQDDLEIERPTEMSYGDLETPIETQRQAYQPRGRRK